MICSGDHVITAFESFGRGRTVTLFFYVVSQVVLPQKMSRRFHHGSHGVLTI